MYCVQLVRTVCISGVAGPRAQILNGNYAVTGDLFNGLMLYQHVERPDLWLRYTGGRWSVGNTLSKDSKNNRESFAYCDGEHTTHPEEGTNWRVRVGNRWETQLAVNVLQVFSCL